MDTITKYTELIKVVVTRLALIWEEKEGDLVIEIRSEKDEIKAKVKGGETKRI